MTRSRLGYITAGIIISLFLGRVGEMIQILGSIDVFDFIQAIVYILVVVYLIFCQDNEGLRVPGTVLVGALVALYAFVAVTRIISFSTLAIAHDVRTRICIGMAVTSAVIWLVFVACFVLRLLPVKKTSA